MTRRLRDDYYEGRGIEMTGYPDYPELWQDDEEPRHARRGIGARLAWLATVALAGVALWGLALGVALLLARAMAYVLAVGP